MDDAFRICHSVKDASGLGATSISIERKKPRTPSTKRSLLKAGINNAPGKKPEEIEKNFMNEEGVFPRMLAVDCNHRLTHQRSQGALGVDHP